MKFKTIAIWYSALHEDHGLSVIDSESTPEKIKEVEKHLNDGWEIVSIVPITSSEFRAKITKSRKFKGFETTGEEKFENIIPCTYTQNLEVFMIKK